MLCPRPRVSSSDFVFPVLLGAGGDYNPQLSQS